MAAGLLGSASALLGLFQGGAELLGVRAAGSAIEEQAIRTQRDTLARNAGLAKEMNEASQAGITLNASAGRYAILQTARTALYETQSKLANKWMQVLSGL